MLGGGGKLDMHIHDIWMIDVWLYVDVFLLIIVYVDDQYLL